MFVNPTTVRVAGGRMISLADHQGDRPIWSSAIVGSDQSVDMTLFRYAKGEKVAGMNNSSVSADERHTNTDYAGQMPDSDDMIVYSIAIEFDAEVEFAGISKLVDDLYGEFYAGGEKPLYDGLPRHFPAGSGLAGMTTENVRYTFSNGIADANSRAKMVVPLHIQPNKKFKWVFKVPGGTLALGTADVLMRVVYRGYRKLSVQ